MLHLKADVKLWGAAVAQKLDTRFRCGFRAIAYGTKGSTENHAPGTRTEMEKNHKPGDGMWLPTQEMNHMHELLF